jgi:hypothetical protein
MEPSPAQTPPLDNLVTHIEEKNEYFNETNSIFSYTVSVSMPSTPTLDFSKDDEQTPLDRHLDEGYLSLGLYDGFDDTGTVASARTLPQ